ncbi:MAG: GNAT family N-acetyltransferase [Myxococcales bacterium]|nr:GNAT family N-acetyltransferase [Myxococcales bacterium]
MVTSLRPVRAADTDALIRLIADVYREYGDALRLDENPFLADAGAFFREGGGEFWVVADNERVVGACGLLMHADAGEITSLYVDAAERGHGWGALLVLEAIAHTVNAGRDRLYLFSDVRFASAHRLYRRLGFKEMPGRRALGDSLHSIEIAFVLDI